MNNNKLHYDEREYDLDKISDFINGYVSISSTLDHDNITDLEIKSILGKLEHMLQDINDNSNDTNKYMFLSLLSSLLSHKKYALSRFEINRDNFSAELSSAEIKASFAYYYILKVIMPKDNNKVYVDIRSRGISTGRDWLITKIELAQSALTIEYVNNDILDIFKIDFKNNVDICEARDTIIQMNDKESDRRITIMPLYYKNSYKGSNFLYL